MYPPAYPTAVVYTPSICQNFFSAPQKHPSPKIARSLPSGNGGCNVVPSTVCRGGTLIGTSRPGKASCGVGILNDPMP